MVKISDDRTVRFWPCPVKGASGFAVWRDNVVMQGGYDSDDWRLLDVNGVEAVVEKDAMTFRTPEGLPLAAKSAKARGSAIWFVVGEDIYRFDLKSYLNR